MDQTTTLFTFHRIIRAISRCLESSFSKIVIFILFFLNKSTLISKKHGAFVWNKICRNTIAHHLNATTKARICRSSVNWKLQVIWWVKISIVGMGFLLSRAECNLAILNFIRFVSWRLFFLFFSGSELLRCLIVWNWLRRLRIIFENSRFLNWSFLRLHISLLKNCCYFFSFKH